VNLLLALACAAALAVGAVQSVALRETRRVQRSLGTARVAVVRRRIRARAGAVPAPADPVRVAATVVAASDGVCEVHHAIAAIPFGILEAIPPTRAVTRVVRAVHDRTTDGVHAAIRAGGRAVSDAERARRGEPAPPDPASAAG
jgi:hypothetical protein